MPKENKTTSKRSKRQCPEVDIETVAVSGTRELAKSMVGSNRYSPFPRDAPRRDTRTEKENMTVSSTEVLQTMSDGIIGSGIKYIMFPLHLLRFCIFGTSSGSVGSEKKKVETQQEESTDKKEKAEDKGKKTKELDGKGATHSETSTRRKEDCLEEERKCSKSSSSRAPRKEEPKQVDKSDNEESTDEMVTAAEDSDSSVDQWSNASSMMNMSVDYDNIDKSMPYALLEEPMDVSMEEQTYEKLHSATKPAEGNRASSYFQVDATRSVPSRFYVDEQNSNSSVDEEIARIFQKQCTSSEDECSSSYSNTLSSSKREKPKQKNFLCNGSIDSFSTATVSRSKKEPRDDERERKKKTSSDVVVNHKRRKVAHNEDKDETRNDRRAETKIRDEKRGSRQDTPSKSKTRSSKTPVKHTESKRTDVKYKETATQTDSAFSDEDVEMLPIETKFIERQFCCKYAAQRLQVNLFQGKGMERELNYIPDNEDSNDGFIDIARKRISSCSTSSSSTDLGFDERVSATPDTDLAKERRHSNSPDTINTHRMYTRAPPGFPQLPQNPPLTTCTYNDSKHLVTTSSRDSRYNPSIARSKAIVPPAPSPLRHLYYDYPEFMDLPAKVNSSKILTNILQNNYYRQ